MNEESEIAALRRKVAELQSALETRVIIEQAKGIIAVRDRVGIDVAFERLRRMARSSRLPLRTVASGIVAAHVPQAVISRR